MPKKFFHKTTSLKRKLLNEQLTNLTCNNMINGDDDIVPTNVYTEEDTNERKEENTSLYNNSNEFLILSNLTVLSKIQKYDKLLIIMHEEKDNKKIDFENFIKVNLIN